MGGGEGGKATAGHSRYLCAQSELAEFLAYLCSCILVQTNKLIKYSQPWHCQTEHFVQNYLCAQSELAEFLAYLCSCILVQTNKLIKYSQPWHCQTEHFVQNYLCAQSELAEFLAYLCSCILVQTNKLIKYSQPWHCQTEHFVQNYLCAQSELAEFLAYLCSCILVQTNKLIKYSQPWHCQTEHFVQNYLCAQSELAEFLAYLCSCILVQTNKLIKYSQPWHCQTRGAIDGPAGPALAGPLFTTIMFINDYYWERLEGGVHMRICDSLLATAQARLNRQRRSTSQDWLDGLKTALWRLQISKFFWGGHAPRPPSGCGLWPHLLWPDEYKTWRLRPCRRNTLCKITSVPKVNLQSS